jgi:predicted ester cyclase
MSNKRVVGKKAFSSFVQQMREAYPDLHYEVGQVRLHCCYCCGTVVVASCSSV